MRKRLTAKIEVTADMKQRIISFVEQNGFISNKQCRVLLGIGYEQAIMLLNTFVESDDLIREGKTSGIKYRLSAKSSSFE